MKYQIASIGNCLAFWKMIGLLELVKNPAEGIT